jgi:hypothetical protein
MTDDDYDDDDMGEEEFECLACGSDMEVEFAEGMEMPFPICMICGHGDRYI